MKNSKNESSQPKSEYRILLEEKFKRIHQGRIPFWDWVQNWRARGEPLEFEDRPWLIPLYQDESRKIVVQKMAQGGYTEWGLAGSIHLPDQRKANSLYVMPTHSALSDLTQGRLNPSIYSSEFLSGRLGKLQSSKYAEKVGLKKLTHGFWYGRGANNPKQVITVDVDGIWVDERDRIEDEIIPYLDKRLQNSVIKLERWYGTPTIPDWGINRMFLEGNQLVWHITCKECKKEQALTYGENVDEEKVQVVCSGCGVQIVPHELEGRYIALNPEGKYHSYYVCGLNSDRIDLPRLIDDMNSGDENRIAQAFNQVLGLPYEPKGATITLEDLFACRGKYDAPYKSEEGIFLGVDVGRYLHITGIQKDEEGEKVVLFEKGSWDDLRRILSDWRVKVCVIDALPELEQVSQIVREFRGKVYACYYSNTKLDAGKYYKFSDGRVDVDRTASLDASLSLITKREIEMPKNLDTYKEVLDHFKNTKRIVVVKDEKTGEKETKWVRIGDDHFAQSYNYAHIATNRLSTLMVF